MRRLFIANRGEIAVRIIRTAREMGIETVAGYSSADRDSLARQLADDAVCIGGPRPDESYLNGPAVVTAAVAKGCDAVHPGYGFLAESSDFARLCIENGLVFVGPSPDVIERMGDKSEARRAAEAAGVAVLPGTGPLATADEASADRVGYPLLLKAVAGGGGRGIRLIHTPNELGPTFDTASREAEAAFGDRRLYMERYLESARHVEVQILGDAHGNVIHLAERECSLQRRHQKVLEESPANIPDSIREEMCKQAVALASHLGYTGAGTVEFLVDTESGELWFIEMNARLQVEHPVTEMRCGVDIVAAQLAVAAGEALPWRQDDILPQGHSIEFRVTCESFEHNFTPMPGTISEWDLPRLPHTRVDTHCYRGYRVPPYYDSLLAKVIVLGPDRHSAVDRLRRAASQYRIRGVPTSLDLLERLFELDDFHTADFHTRWLEPAIAGLQGGE